MKKYSIVSGSFSDNDNFTGYTADGQRIHVYKQQMDALGFSKDKAPTFPLFCSAEEREFKVRDEKGELTDDTFTRLTCGAIFKDRKGMVTVLAQADERLIDAGINAEVRKIAKEDGLVLSDIGLAELEQASVEE